MPKHSEIAAGRAEAQVANAAKGRFLSQMSQELRAPLDVIVAMARAELHSSRYEASRDRLQVLIAEAEGLGTVLDDILDLAALQDGRMTILPVVCDTRAEIEASLALYAPYVETAGLHLAVEFARDLPSHAMFDPKRLRQCLSDLLSHAAKNITKGSIRVLASAAPARRDAPPELRIEVSVSHPGITADQHRALVAPFASAESAPRPDDAPVLGLAICHSLARQMGGDLVVQATGAAPEAAREGTHFVLTLSAPLPPAGAKLPAPAVAMSAMPMSDKRVLVIDDVSMGALAVIECLRVLGASVLEVADVAGALRVLAKAPVDLVLVDQKSPEVDGPAALRAIRALPGSTGRVPVVALTANASAGVSASGCGPSGLTAVS